MFFCSRYIRRSSLDGVFAVTHEKISDLLHWQALPAFPGFILWSTQDNELTDPEPIIGWLVEQRKTMSEGKYFWWGKPLVASTHDTDEYQYAIELPNGKVWFPEELMADSLDDAREHLRKKRDAA
jgi:hypothetical protein